MKYSLWKILNWVISQNSLNMFLQKVQEGVTKICMKDVHNRN